MTDVLGVDPGTRHTAWCYLPDPEHLTLPPAWEHTDRRRKTRAAYASRDTSSLLWIAGTVRRSKLEDVRTYETRAVLEISNLARRYRAGLVALEDFEHRGYLGRRIDQAPEMGRLLGLLQATLESRRVSVVTVPARVSKAGCEALRGFHRNGHEWSACCVALAGARAANLPG